MSAPYISRRRFLALAFAGAAASSLLCGSCSAEGEARKPNVIVILTDDQGWADVTSQGCKDVKTPNLDSIGKNGVRFTSGYTSCPVCSPMRAGLMTGRYQQRFGYEHNPGGVLDNKPWGLPTNEKTFGQYMKDQGYRTAAIGKWHLGDTDPYHPNRRGFDEFFGFIGGAHTYLRPGRGFNRLQRNGARVPRVTHLTDAFGQEAVAFIERNKEKPFFLYLAFNAVHQPLEVPPGQEKAFPEIQDPKRRRFAALLKNLDDNVGKVLAKVRDAGLEKDTLIVYMADNGGPTPGNTSRNDPFKGYKGQVHEGGIRVPFMMQWTGKIPAGKVDDRPVISLDLLPTAVAAAGGKAASSVEGVNLLPFLTGEKEGSPHEALFWRYGKDSAIRQGDWKLARREGKGARLYNLAEDKKEARDLSAEKPERVKELTAAWDAWDKDNKKAMWPKIGEANWEGDGW